MAYVGIVNGSYAHRQEEPAYFTVVVLFSAFLLFGSVLTSKQKKNSHAPTTKVDSICFACVCSSSSCHAVLGSIAR